jgi:photosystem II stability/assembly factor-like uncharacterized protein
MTNTSTRYHEELTDEVDVGIPPSPGDTQALFKEARRRRRQRRLAAVLVIVLVAGLVITGAILAGFGSNGRPGKGVGDWATPSQPSPSQKDNQKQNGLGPASAYPPAQSMGIADSEVGWVTDGTDLYVTTDGGSTWRTVTPPNVDGVTVSIHITAVDAVGTDDLWAVLEDVPGLVPFGQSTNGSVRGQGIDRSTDGGKTWTFTALPGCLQTCGPLSVSFVDATHGFAATAPQSGESTLFATQDGGMTWTPLASMPNLGSVEVGGPIAQPQLVFTSNLDGWAVTGASGYGQQGQPTAPGGVLYRTTNGGVSWALAPGLPSGLHHTVPAFFGNEQAVVLATHGPSDSRGAAVYVTVDGGSRWTRYPLPVIRGDVFTPGNLLTRFAAVGLFEWRIDVGSLIYETNNGGRTWATITPTPKTSLGDATSVVFSSPDIGMAIAQLPSCFTQYTSDPTADVCYPVLIVTSDGGRTWSPASLPNEPPWHSAST